MEDVKSEEKIKLEENVEQCNTLQSSNEGSGENAKEPASEVKTEVGIEAKEELPFAACAMDQKVDIKPDLATLSTLNAMATVTGSQPQSPFVDYSAQLRMEIKSLIESTDVIDLTSDNVDCSTNVRFSSRKKKKKDKKKKKSKQKDKERTNINVGLNIRQNENQNLINEKLTGSTNNEDFIVTESVDCELGVTENENNVDLIENTDRKQNIGLLVPQRELSKRTRKTVNYNEIETLQELEIEREGEFHCHFCKCNFPSSEDLFQHLCEQKNKPCDFHCSECTKSFTTEFGLIVHSRKAHGKVKSKACKEALKTESKSKKTKRVKLRDGKHFCTECDEAFSSQIYLSVHKQAFHDKSGENPLKCPKEKCDFKIEALQKYKTHLKKVHHAPPFRCPQCEQSFSDFGNMTRHMKLHFGIKDYKCNECGKWFTDYTGLTSHTRHNHTQEKPYKCDQCPFTFATKSDLTRHCLYRHSDVRKHKCPICGKLFKMYGGMIAHMKREVGEKAWQCGVCTKRFFCKSSLQTHMLTHTNLKMCRCALCDKEFTHMASLKAHLRTHTGSQPYNCRFCKRRFSHRSNMRRHEKTIHAGRMMLS